MSPWCAAAVDTITGREVASAPAFAAASAPPRFHKTTMTTIAAAATSQIHQRLLWVLEFSFVRGSDFPKTAESGPCSVTCTPQVDEGQQLSLGASAESYHLFHYPFDVRKSKSKPSFL